MPSLSIEFWIGTGIAVLLSILAFGVGVGMDAKTKGEYVFVIACFCTSWLMLVLMIGLWTVTSGTQLPGRLAGVFAIALVSWGAIEAVRWAQFRHWAASETISAPPMEKKAPIPQTPSLIFVIGVPLGDNDSPTWLMLLRHYGSNTVYSCQVDLIDDDRKNIEHQWLAKHPNSPFLPAGMFPPSQTSIRVAEGGPEGPLPNFTWKPLDPNRQHYTILISCRDGYFIQKWEVTRVNRILRTKISVEHGQQWIANNPTSSAVVFQCQDPEFVSTDLLTVVPQRVPRQPNPGWKPNHRFEVPAAIIDSNGNVQVLFGVQQPDGSTWTDFGCWNYISKHFGDTSSE